MSSRRAEGALAVLIAIGSLGCAAFAAGQTAEVLPVALGVGVGISDDGKVVVGQDSSFPWSEAFRWDEATSTARSLGSLSDDVSGSYAYGASADGSVVVGWTNFDPGFGWPERAFRWQKSATPGTETGTMQAIGALGDTGSTSFAYDVSDDGVTLVGKVDWARPSATVARAFSWSGGRFRDLGPQNEPLSESTAWGVSGDGKVVVGQCKIESTVPHAFRWTAETGMVDIGSLNTPLESSIANAISRNGEIIVGKSGNRAFIKRGNQPMELLPAFTPSGTAEAFDVSHNGRIVVGVINGAAGIWIDSQPRALEELLLGEFGVDADEYWWSLQDLKACSADGRYVVGTGRHRTLSGSVAFRAYLPFPNIVPTVDPIVAKTIECNGEHNLVTLETPVADGDGDRLKVEWFVNGVPVQTTANHAPGIATFQHDFPHGATDVVVQVTDYKSPILQQATTVTVQDTTDPVVVVAATQIVPTDRGLNYATKINIPKPQVNEACDGAPVLTSDAPEILPIGTYTVTWTVKDFSDNVGTATQQIVVRDLEAPELLATPVVTRGVDRGEIFATINLPQPQVFDNASAVGRVVIQSNARPRYPVGTTLVTWTATDEAGNVGRATTNVTVVNRRPTANAGKNVVINTTSEKGARVRVSAARSSDPDGHTLKYLWSGRGVRFNSKKSKTPMGTFKVGVTNVKLTVIDEAGARHVDTVRVTVRLKNGKRRPRGAEANEAFARASSAAAGSVGSGSASGASVAGYGYAAAADGFGLAAGEFIRWEEGQSEQDGQADYATLRYYQALYGEQATNELIRAYGESGDDGSLQAAIEAARGVQAARADLFE
ncbi:MAG TPA: HYR domain-containing protein [Pirellulaceae bacterium]|jgi:probable HAF family extracellular repeat protein|nr:HYR domain-containing protein [Pirellulaceae bacterium]